MTVIDLDARRHAKQSEQPMEVAWALVCPCGCDRMQVLIVPGSLVPRIQCGNCATALFGPPDENPAA